MRNRWVLLMLGLVMVIGLYEANKDDEHYYFEKEGDNYVCFYLRRKEHKKTLCIASASNRRQALKAARLKADKMQKHNSLLMDVNRIK